MNDPDQALVSIVLPTYKRADVLPYAIDSVLAQTHTHWELIVIDDASPDHTREVIKSYDDPRIRYFRNTSNLKLPRSLNKGFYLAQGAYLTWTSDDNLFKENAIEKMVHYLRTSGCDFVYANYFLFEKLDSRGNPVPIRIDNLPDSIRLEQGNHIGACFLYTRRVYESIGDYDPQLFLVEDYDFFIRVSKSFKMCHLSEPLYYFRRDDNTLYCSRFCLVKAADALVRFKNGLLDENQVIDNLTSLLLKNPMNLNIPLYRWCVPVTKRFSFRLHQSLLSYLTGQVRNKLSQPVKDTLAAYQAQQLSFSEARDRLCALMQQIGKVEYRSS